MAVDPTDARGRYALAKNLLHLGSVQAKAHPDQSLPNYQAGIAILEPMVKAAPDDWLMEGTLADLYSSSGLATVQLASSRCIFWLNRGKASARTGLLLLFGGFQPLAGHASAQRSD